MIQAEAPLRNSGDSGIIFKNQRPDACNPPALTTINRRHIFGHYFMVNGPRVPAAVNVFSTDEPHRELNRHIIDYAAQIAQTAGGRIDLIDCRQLPGETILSSVRTRLPGQGPGRILKITESGHRRRLDDFVAQYD
jgi:hypothetical protein